MDALNIIFAGTPDFAAEHLKALVNSRHNVIAVYSQPDRPAGRGKKLQPSPVKKVALDNDIPVYQPLNFKQEGALEELQALNADIMVVVAYGLLLPTAVLAAPKMGCINVHASILPRWRGAAPIQRAVEAGDSETGITIMQMDEGLDTGDMLNKVTVDIRANETGGSLHDRLLEKGPQSLMQTLTLLQAGEAIAEKQNDLQANYAHKLSKEEALISWNDSAENIERRIRAFNPFPVAYTLLGDQRIKVWQACNLGQTTRLLPGTIAAVSNEGIDVATGDGIIRLVTLQLPNKKAMSVADILNGQGQLFQPQHMFSSQA